MAENLFTEFPTRISQLRQYSDLEKLATPLEDAYGAKDTFRSPAEAMELYLSVLEEIGKLAGKEIKPGAAEIDREGARIADGKVTLPAKLQENLKKCAELGIFAGPVARAHGGLNLPRAVQSIAMEMLAHACPNTAVTVAAYSMGEFVQLFGTEEQKAFYIPKLLQNEWTTSMALTEPGAGSDLGKLTTQARRDGDHWIVDGTKIFISYGHSDITFALVRTEPGSTGLGGLSVVIVPSQWNGRANYQVTRIEDKVCLHASPTCELVFEGSVGYLLGPEGGGFKVMAELMNTARLGMATLAVGISCAALEEAERYAATRVTMGKPIAQHPMVAEMLREMQVEIHAMRALVTEAAMASDWMNIARKNGDERAYRKWKKRYRRLTPLCKYLCSEKAITITRNAVQIFGGYGVCRDYPVERLWRESIIYPIYEGTSQIQSLMVLKDTLKDVSLQAGGFLGSLAGAWAEAKVTRDPVKSRLLEARNELNQGIRTILMFILRDKFKSDLESLKNSRIQEFLRDFSLELLSSKTDLAFPFLCAERFTRITCDYYALKCMADHHPPGDAEHERRILDFAELALPRMRLENEYMVSAGKRPRA